MPFMNRNVNTATIFAYSSSSINMIVMTRIWTSTAGMTPSQYTLKVQIIRLNFAKRWVSSSANSLSKDWYLWRAPSIWKCSTFCFSTSISHQKRYKAIPREFKYFLSLENLSFFKNSSKPSTNCPLTKEGFWLETSSTFSKKQKRRRFMMRCWKACGSYCSRNNFQIWR